MLHCAPSPTPPNVFPSPTLPGPVLTRVQLAPQSSDRQISSFSPPVPSHTRRVSNGSTMMAAATVPLMAGVADVPIGVTSSHFPASGKASHFPTGPGGFIPPVPEPPVPLMPCPEPLAPPEPPVPRFEVPAFEQPPRAISSGSVERRYTQLR